MSAIIQAHNQNNWDALPFEDGWIYASDSWNDMEPYDPNFCADHIQSDKERESYEAGYYAFWQTKNVSLDE